MPKLLRQRPHRRLQHHPPAVNRRGQGLREARLARGVGGQTEQAPQCVGEHTRCLAAGGLVVGKEDEVLTLHRVAVLVDNDRGSATKRLLGRLPATTLLATPLLTPCPLRTPRRVLRRGVLEVLQDVAHLAVPATARPASRRGGAGIAAAAADAAGARCRRAGLTGLGWERGEAWARRERQGQRGREIGATRRHSGGEGWGEKGGGGEGWGEKGGGGEGWGEKGGGGEGWGEKGGGGEGWGEKGGGGEGWGEKGGGGEGWGEKGGGGEGWGEKGGGGEGWGEKGGGEEGWGEKGGGGEGGRSLGGRRAHSR